MKDSQDIEILEALNELKNQIHDLKAAIADSIEHDSIIEHIKVTESDADNLANNIEDYKPELTPQEINALLSSPLDDFQSYSSEAVSDPWEEINQLKTELQSFKEHTEKDMDELKKSVLVLSEMFGRHELEIKKSMK